MKTSLLIAEYFCVEENHVSEMLMGCDLLSDCGEHPEDFNNGGDLEVVSFALEEPCEKTILEEANRGGKDPWEDNDSYITEEAVILQKSTGKLGKFFASYSKGSYKEGGQWCFSDNLICNVKSVVEMPHLFEEE